MSNDMKIGTSDLQGLLAKSKNVFFMIFDPGIKLMST